MKYAIQTTAIFDKWASSLKGTAAAKVVGMRLDRLANGNLGDIKTLGDGVSEMRFFVGAGYRIYFTIRGIEIIVLLCGGDKSSQQSDIKKNWSKICEA